MKKYNPQEIEPKWQKIWQEEKLYQAKDQDEQPKFYCLDMFPYPSGEGLHVGHWRGFVLSDVIARFQKLQGKNVLHPMGWDAFGLPAENAAIKNKSHPKIYTEKAISNFKRQLGQIGAMFDFSREINTSDPAYYRWTQWIFLQLYKNKLAYRKKAPVNWCPSCQTVLANEQVVAGECERCGSTVVQKDLTQWFFKITDFAEDLLKDLDTLDWPEKTKRLQKNWIGKSEGTNIKFPISTSIRQPADQIDVFTTRADTLFGCTYIVLAPEHPLINNLKSQIKNWEEVQDYINNAKKKSALERQELQKEKTGVKLEGIKAINPINNEEIDVYIADYVLSSYGTGAVMAVPAHDQRDFEFAKKYDIPIKKVIIAQQNQASSESEHAFEEYGSLVDSGEFSKLSSEEAKKKITEKLKTQNQGDFAVNYRLRDWLISRQRYWGAPIPIIYCNKCGEVPVPEEDLPVKLPEDVEFNPKGESPLKQSAEFLKTKCPKCGADAVRETDTMDTFVCSSWYYLRYCDPKNDKLFSEKTFFKKPPIEPSKKDLDYINEFKAIYSDLDDKGIKVWATNRFMLNGLNGCLWLPLRTISFMVKEKDITQLENYIQNRGYKLQTRYKYGILYAKDEIRFEYIKVVEENNKLISYSEKGAPQEMKKEDLSEQTFGKLDRFAYRIVNPAYNLAHYRFIQKNESDTRIGLGDEEKIKFLEQYLESINRKIQYWMPVDFYVGGVEHAVLHLLYARFVSKALHRLKLIDFSPNGEPFKKLFNIGMVYLHGAKMSKSKGNIVSPDDLIKEYGTDALRGYELFIGPADLDSEWQIKGISGIYRLLEKIWLFFQKDFKNNQESEPIVEKTIQTITNEIENVKPNTAISHLMEMFNQIKNKDISKETAKKINILISPFFPHLAEEIWQNIGHEDSVFLQRWPKFDSNLIKEEKIKIAVQINGKVRDIIEIDKNISQEELETSLKDSEKIGPLLINKKIKKVIFISGKVINFVVE